MGLIDDLNRIELPVFNCGVAKALEALPPDEQQALLAALNDHMLPASRISYALKNNGHAVSARTVQRHRSRNTDKDSCTCP